MNTPGRLTPLLALLAAVALTGCDTEEPATDPNLSGHYVGFGGGYAWALDLSDGGGTLTGTGTVETSEASFPVTVEGATTFPVVGLELEVEGLGQFTFDGRVSNGGDVLTGTVSSGDGFNAETAFQRE
ncbi:MAG TPA: hypothetical protein VK002_09245 [Rubricoccaceae bacterium]|nr:hypothetical protein [Rubricoccaceae bacterium]